MIQTVNTYLKRLQTDMETHDHSSVMRAVRRAGVDPCGLSTPSTEFIADCTVWAAVNIQNIKESIMPGADLDKALDQLASRVISDVAASWDARSRLLTQIDAPANPARPATLNFLSKAGISPERQEKARMTVRTYLAEQIS